MHISNLCTRISRKRHVVSIMANTVCEPKDATQRLNEVLDAGFSYTIAASRLLFSHQSTARLNPGGMLSFQAASPFAQAPRGVNTVTGPRQAFSVVRPLLVSISPSDGQWMMACASQPVNPAGLPPADFDEVMRLRGLTSLRRCNGHTNHGPMALSIFLRAMLAPPKPRGADAYGVA
jgi:hypothetical protein